MAVKLVRAKPFLHPAARPFSPTTAAARQGLNAHHLNAISHLNAGHVGAMDRLAQISAKGPKAPEKVKRALSGRDPSETISRLGRATRRQNKEFSATVHPISGRITEMNRGGHLSTGMSAFTRSETRRRAGALADRSSNPHVKERAAAVASGAGGPVHVLVHNHPTFHEPHGGHKGTREYPSGMDTAAAAQMAYGSNQPTHMVVLAHRPGPRGSKQTVATHLITHPGKPEDTVNAHLQGLAEHDVATQTKGIRHRAEPGEREVMQAQTAAVRRKRHADNLAPYRGNPYRNFDAGVRQSTTGRAGQRVGQHSRQSLHKRFGMQLSAFGVWC